MSVLSIFLHFGFDMKKNVFNFHYYIANGTICQHINPWIHCRHALFLASFVYVFVLIKNLCCDVDYFFFYLLLIQVEWRSHFTVRHIWLWLEWCNLTMTTVPVFRLSSLYFFRSTKTTDHEWQCSTQL